MLNSNSIDSSKGMWFKALVFMKCKDIDALKAILKKISADKNNYNYNKALLVLEELE